MAACKKSPCSTHIFELERKTSNLTIFIYIQINVIFIVWFLSSAEENQDTKDKKMHALSPCSHPERSRQHPVLLSNHLKRIASII